MNSRPLRIAVIGPRGIPSSYSGIERVAESLYGILAERGHEVTVYCRPEYVPASPHIYRGVRLVRAPALNGRSLGTLSHVAASTAHATLRGDYDVVHLHALAPGLLSPLCRLFSIPTVATVQGLDWQRAKWKGLGSKVLRRAERSLVANVDEIITVSRDLERYFLSEYGRRTVVIPNGTEPTPLDTPLDQALLDRLGLVPHQYVLFVARLVPEKRAEDLIRAVRAVDTPFKLAIVGDSSHTDAYVAELHRLAAGDPRVVFAGTRPRADLDSLFRAAAVYVLPSELEGMPMALLQSLEVGVPAIVSDIPVHQEIFEPIPDYDLLFPTGNVAALAACLTRVLAHSDHYRGVAARVQEHVRRSYSWPAIAAQTESLYYQIVERKTRRTARQSAPAAILDPSRSVTA